MNQGNFRGTPPETPAEWRRIWKAIEEHETDRPAVRDIVLIVNAAAVVRRVSPYAIGAAIVGAALYNSGYLIGLMGK